MTMIHEHTEKIMGFLCSEHITQNVVKSHIETSQYSTEELKRMAWSLYSPEETRTYQTKVGVAAFLFTHKECCICVNYVSRVLLFEVC